MISARRAALLGLTEPLSAIMLAVLGLWPEPEEDSAPEVAHSTADPKGGGNALKAAEIKDRKRRDEEIEDAYLAAVRNRRKAQNRAAIMSTIALVIEEEYA